MLGICPVIVGVQKSLAPSNQNIYRTRFGNIEGLRNKLQFWEPKILSRTLLKGVQRCMVLP